MNIGFVMKSKILNGNMFNQEIILTKNECKSIIEMNNGFTQSKLGTDRVGYVSNIRTSTESKVYTSREVKSILLPKLLKYGVTNLPNKFSILKYEIGQEFKKHRDVGGSPGIDKRYKTLIIQLSENYKGGELVIWDNDDEVVCDTTIGNMILFPSNLYHQAKVLEEGIRYVMVFFLKRKNFGIRKSII